jgi:hypothetical protein
LASHAAACGEETWQTEDEVQAMKERGDSLDKVELVVAIQEVREQLHQ